MTTQVSTLLPVRELSDLKQEWRVLAFRPNGSGSWQWYLSPTEIKVLDTLRRDGMLVSAHRRDGDGTRLLAKVRGKK